MKALAQLDALTVNEMSDNEVRGELPVIAQTYYYMSGFWNTTKQKLLRKCCVIVKLVPLNNDLVHTPRLSPVAM